MAEHVPTAEPGNEPDTAADPDTEPVAEPAPENTPQGKESAPSEPDSGPRRSVAGRSIGVDVDLLDKLIRLVGELVLTRNQMVRAAEAANAWPTAATSWPAMLCIRADRRSSRFRGRGRG